MTGEKLLTEARDLKRRKARERRGRFVAEGIRTVEALLASPVVVRGVLTSPALLTTPRGEALAAALADRAVPRLAVDAPTLAGAADTESPQGVLAIAEVPARSLAELPAPAPWLVCDGVQDPGNVGALIRTAAALGASATVLLPGTADAWNAKAVRATMGAAFTHPVAAAPWPEVRAALAATGARVLAAAADGTPVARPEPDAAFALVVGNEGAGVGAAILADAAARVAVRMHAGVESLNVAVAGGILLHALRPPVA